MNNIDIIPKDLEEAINILDLILTGEEKLQIAALKEKELSNLHHSFGQHLRNKWKLWHYSDIKKYMEKIGFYHPDDMSHAIIKTYYYKLNDKTFDVKEYAKKCTEFYLKDITLPDTI